MSNIQTRIKELRKNNGYTQEELAKLLNLHSKSSIANYESGANLPSDDIKKKMCELFDCSMDYLIGESKYKNIKKYIDQSYDTKNNRLKDLREDFNCTQSQIAEFLRITRPQYSLYESGKRDIPVLILLELAQFFHCSIEYILGLSYIKNQPTSLSNSLIVDLDMMQYTPPTDEQKKQIKNFAEFILKDNKKKKQEK